MDNSALGRVYEDGEVIVRQGEVGECMYALEEGRLEVLAHHEGRGEVRIGVLEKGAIFGEMAIVEHEVRSATVQALGAARVLTIDRKNFLRRVHEDPSLALNVIRIMSQRIRRLTDQMGERRSGTDRRRLATRRQGDRRTGG